MTIGDACSGRRLRINTIHLNGIIMNLTEEITVVTDAKQRLSDILLAISWREIARTYFGKSSSWLYHKLDGIKSDGSQGGGFSPRETEKLRESLLDLSARIEKAASSL